MIEHPITAILLIIGGTVGFMIVSIGPSNDSTFSDNTNFRAFWYGTNKLLMNAIFFREEM
jgi:hypothetical protein